MPRNDDLKECCTNQLCKILSLKAVSIRSVMNDKGRVVCKTDFHPIQFKISFPLFNTTSQKKLDFTVRLCKMLTPGHQTARGTERFMLQKGLAWFSRRQWGRPGSLPHCLVPCPTAGAHAAGQQHGPVRRLLCDGCGRPAAQALGQALSWPGGSRAGLSVPPVTACQGDA